MARAESPLYKEASIPGKGTGCIAVKDIKKGNLVLKELPQLLIEDDFDNLHKNAIKSFLKMSLQDQKRYMKLSNLYEEDSENWTEGMREILNEAMSQTNGMVFSNISKEKAMKVWGIFKTNTFTNSVYLQMSRFNHSCHPNAEMSCHMDNTADVRALRKINQGEEITICYTNDTSLWSREERQAELKNVYNFDCNCEGCDAAEEQIQLENESIAAFRQELASVKDRAETVEKMTENQQNELELDLLKEKVERAKRLSKLGKTIKPIHRGWLLDNIVNPGFKGSCWCIVGHQGDEEEEAWKEEAKWFAKVGLKIARTLYGQDSRLAQMWQERYEDPIKADLKYRHLI